QTVTHNIYFFHQVSQVYRMVKEIALKNPAARANYLNKLKKTKNGKTLVLLITSNAHFYGSLDTELSEFFIKQTLNLECDRMVIGKSGIDYLLGRRYNHKFDKITFKKEFPDFDELKALIDKVFKYSKVYAFYTKFETL